MIHIVIIFKDFNIKLLTAESTLLQPPIHIIIILLLLCLFALLPFLTSLLHLLWVNPLPRSDFMAHTSYYPLLFPPFSSFYSCFLSPYPTYIHTWTIRIVQCVYTFKSRMRIWNKTYLSSEFVIFPSIFLLMS